MAGDSTLIVVFFFRTPRSAPHFTTRPRAQPITERMQWGRRGDQATENARHKTPRHGVEERPRLSRGKRGAGLGFPMGCGESPQKIGMVGCETSRRS